MIHITQPLFCLKPDKCLKCPDSYTLCLQVQELQVMLLHARGGVAPVLSG